MEINQSNIPGLYNLKPSIQNYAWGGYEFLAELDGIENEAHLPMAENWYGDHQKAPAQIFFKGNWVSLDQCIQHNPKHFLGDLSQNEVGLPFLLKVLDVRSMLSIQAHPNREQARIGFAQENQRKIPLNDPKRTFKDKNHKPELMVALSDFWLLHGFRSFQQIKKLLRENPAFIGLDQDLNELTIKALYEKVMTLDSEQRDLRLSRLYQQLAGSAPDKDHPDFWALRAFETYGKDLGIFSIYLLNLVRLRPGQAIFQDAGIPHAYLEGQNVEIMANSDNVFRGGLTGKHIDIPLLLSSLWFSEIDPDIQKPNVQNHLIEYRVPVKDFTLQQYSGRFSEDICFDTPVILLCMQGPIKCYSEDIQTIFTKGSAFYLIPNIGVRIIATEECSLFVASYKKE